MTTNVKPINKCEKCGCEILDGDRLCIHCYKKRVVLVSMIFVAIWIGSAVITSLLSENIITFGVWWFWFILFPNLIKKSKFITPRKMYYDTPVTLTELAPKLMHNEEAIKKYRKSVYGKDDKEKITSKNFALFAERDIYRDLAKAKSNILSEFPNYISFTRN